jgi:hypothetical protein
MARVINKIFFIDCNAIITDGEKTYQNCSGTYFRLN